VRLEVTARLLDIRTARASLAVAERSLEAARENVRVNQDRYQAGVSLSSDLLDAESQLLRAGLDRTRSVTTLLVARAGLDRAVGN
jgi:outer membrane protein TolC